MEEQNSFDHKVKRVIKSVEGDKLIQEFKDYESSMNSEVKRKSYWKYWVGVAAIVLVFFSIYFINSEKAISTQEIYSNHFSMLKNSVVPIIRNADIKDLNLQEKAFAYYELKNYEKAQVSFDSLKQISIIDNGIIDLYLANIYLHNDLPEKAFSLLNEISLEHEKRDQILWYKGLSYLKLQKVEEAQESFQKLEEVSTYRKKQVLQILERLSKITSQDKNDK